MKGIAIFKITYGEVQCTSLDMRSYPRIIGRKFSFTETLKRSHKT